MLLAMDTLSATAQWVIYLIALALFLLAALGVVPRDSRFNLTALGLAFLVFPLFWNNLAAS
jgi:hypothetical protein